MVGVITEAQCRRIPTIVLSVIENNLKMTTGAKDEQIFYEWLDWLTTEQQKTFQQSAMKTWNIVPVDL